MCRLWLLLAFTAADALLLPSLGRTLPPARTAAASVVAAHARSMGCVMFRGAEAVLGSMGIRPSSEQMWGVSSASLCVATGQGSWRTRALANRASAL